MTECYENLLKRFQTIRKFSAAPTTSTTTANNSEDDSFVEHIKLEDAKDRIKGIGENFTGWVKKGDEEPGEEITEISELPDDFDMKNEVLSEDQCYKITLQIIRATEIVPMDSNGLSDPFVEIALHKDLVLKTKVINKALNPVWNETFTLFIDDRSTLANIHVYDYDLLGSNDRIGYIDLDMASIPPFHRYTATVDLMSSVEGKDYVGKLAFSYLVEIVKTDAANDLRSIGTKGQEKLLGVIQITVIEGMDLPPMNTDGSCDPFIRLQLGDQQFETKTVQSTLNPTWRETFEFRFLNTSGSVIQASLWDSEPGLQDNIIGETEIDIDKIAPNKPFKYVFGLDHTNTKISLLIKVLKFAELGAAELQLQKEINDAEARILEEQYAIANTMKDVSNVGYLIVKLIRATNIPNKTLGSVDPYVVMEIENCRTVSPVRENCVEPEWNLTYRFPVNDYHSILHISLWDEEDLVKDSLLGRIALPLFNCNGLKKYILKNSKLSEIGKGELVIEATVFHNPIRATLRTFSPKEEIIMKEPTKFDTALLQRDVTRITAQVEMLQDMGEGLDNILRWRSKPVSLFSMIIFVLFVYYIELWMVPLSLGMLLLWNNVAQTCGIKAKEAWVKNNLNRSYYEKEKSKSENEKSKGGIGAKLDKMKTIFSTVESIQTGLNSGASIGEKLGHIGQWKNPLISTTCMLIMLGAGVLLMFVSLRLVIIAWGLNKFRKFYFQPNLVDNNELEDLLSRVPSFPEIEEMRQLRTRPNKTVANAADQSDSKEE